MADPRPLSSRDADGCAGLTFSASFAHRPCEHLALRFKCPDLKVEFIVTDTGLDVSFPVLSGLQLVQMDLSSSTVPTAALESIIGGCRLLECLSLEGLRLSDAVIT